MLRRCSCCHLGRLVVSTAGLQIEARNRDWLPTTTYDRTSNIQSTLLAAPRQRGQHDCVSFVQSGRRLKRRDAIRRDTCELQSSLSRTMSRSLASSAQSTPLPTTMPEARLFSMRKRRRESLPSRRSVSSRSLSSMSSMLSGS
jgi:hypothetical protein